MQQDFLSAELYELTLASPNLEKMISFYEHALGYRFKEEDGAWVGRAAERSLRLISGQARQLAGVVYRVANRADLEGLRQRLDMSGVLWRDAENHGRDVIFVLDPDGNEIAFGLYDQVATPGTQNLAAARLQHVVMATTQPERLTAFYSDILGFMVSDRVLDENGGLRAAFLRTSDEHHSFALFKAPSNRFDHHCYETADWNAIRDWADHFAACEVPIKWGPGRHGPGNNLFLFIHDPDGNWIEISAELERVDQSRPAGTWPHEERTINQWGGRPPQELGDVIRAAVSGQSLDSEAQAKSMNTRVLAGSEGLQRGGGLPMYAQLLALFRQRIETGEWPIDEQIPTLEELAAEFDVARVTIRTAIGLLEAEGLVGRYRGRGTFVLQRPESTIWYRIPIDLQTLVGTTPDIEFEWLDNMLAEVPPARSHGIGDLAPAYQFMRRRLLRHHIPYCIGSTFIEKTAFDAIGSSGFGAPVPLAMLNTHLPGGIAHAEQTIRASAADLKNAQLLQLDSGAPVMIVTRSVLNQDGVLVYESHGVFRGDFVEIHSNLV